MLPDRQNRLNGAETSRIDAFSPAIAQESPHVGEPDREQADATRC